MSQYSGQVNAMIDFRKWINISHSRIYQIMKLLLIAPEIQEAIILQDNPKIDSLSERSIKKIPMTVDWDTQRELWQKCL